MIIYKINEIKKVIEDNESNVVSIRHEASEKFDELLMEYRKKKSQIENSRDYSEEGRKNRLKVLSKEYYEKSGKLIKKYENQIITEYDSSIEEVKKLTEYDEDRQKVFRNSEKNKYSNLENMLYVTNMLGNIDTSSSNMLVDMMNEYKEDNKILSLIRAKAMSIKKNDPGNKYVNEVLTSLQELDKSYVQDICNSKEETMKLFDNKDSFLLMPTSRSRLFDYDETNVQSFFS